MNSSKRETLRRAALAVVLGVALSPAVVRASDVEKVLKSLEERRGRAKSLHTVTETLVHQSEVTRKTRFEYWELKTGETRKTRRVGRTETVKKGTEKPEIAESVSVSDGRFQWSELPGTGIKTVIKSTATEVDEFKGLRDAMRQGKARTRPGEKLLGMKTVVIEVAGRGSGGVFKATYWIGEQNGVILKSRVTYSDGSRIETDTSLCEIDKKIPESTFTYAVPDGAQLIDTTTIGRKTGTEERP